MRRLVLALFASIHSGPERLGRDDGAIPRVPFVRDEILLDTDGVDLVLIFVLSLITSHLLCAVGG